MSDELVKWHEAQADYAMNSLSCGSNNYEYRQAHKEADFHRSAAARIRLLEQQLKTAREALEPFAKEAFRYEPPEGDDDMNAWDSQFTIGQLRSAAAAIRSLGEPGAHPPGE